MEQQSSSPRQSPRRKAGKAEEDRDGATSESQRRRSSRKRSRDYEEEMPDNIRVKRQEATGADCLASHSGLRCSLDALRSDQSPITTASTRGSSSSISRHRQDGVKTESSNSFSCSNFSFHPGEALKPFDFSEELRHDPASLSFGDSIQGFPQPPSIIYDTCTPLSKLSGESLVQIAQTCGSSGKRRRAISLVLPVLRETAPDYGSTSANYHSTYSKRSSETTLLDTFRLKKQKLSHRIRSFLLLRPPGLPLIGTDGAADIAAIIRAPLWLKTATCEMSRESRMCPKEWRWSGDNVESSNWTVAALEQDFSLCCRVKQAKDAGPQALAELSEAMTSQDSPCESRAIAQSNQPKLVQTTDDLEIPRQRGASAPPLMHANIQSFKPQASLSASPSPSLAISTAASPSSSAPAVPPSVLKAQLLSVLRGRLGDAAKAGSGPLRMKKFVVWNAWIRRPKDPSPAEISGRSSPQSDDEALPLTIPRLKSPVRQGGMSKTTSSDSSSEDSSEEELDMDALIDLDEESGVFSLDGASVSSATAASSAFSEIATPARDLYRQDFRDLGRASLSPSERRELAQPTNTPESSAVKQQASSSPASPRLRASSLPLADTPGRSKSRQTSQCKSYLDPDSDRSNSRPSLVRQRPSFPCASAA